jgi:1-acyl-sn-glycerol-3-phosphate acyltransferase
VDPGLTILLVVTFFAGFSLRRLGRAAKNACGADWGVGWLNRLDGLNRLFCRHYHRLPDVSIPLPERGSAIVVCNHISGLDPLLMMASSPRPLRFLIAREQYERFGLRWLFRAVGCIPVDRERSPEKALRSAFKALRNGEVLAIFPHGKIHLDSDPPRKLKAGAVRLARNTGSMLFPLRITGVTRQGDVIAPVFIRSRAKVTLYAPIDSRNLAEDEILSQIESCITGNS